MTTKPIFFERNRVGRVYTGGKLFSQLFGDEPIDGYKPEEWIASAVRAINKNSAVPNEGISKVKGTDLYFDTLLKQKPSELLGEGRALRILVKALDSAVRLPAQVHPDKEFSKKYFNSSYGKTECWVILDTRPDAKLFFGFKDGVTKADLQHAIDQSETDSRAMERLMVEITPKKGEVYFVPAKTVHAIGKGCLILEVQEPTDFTIQPERYCGEYRLSNEEMYLSLSREQAAECFDFGKAPDAKIILRLIYQNNKITKEALVGAENTDCFVINRIKLYGGEYMIDLNNSYGIYFVTEGGGVITNGGYEKRLKKGDYFFMPAAAMGKFKILGNTEIIECY